MRDEFLSLAEGARSEYLGHFRTSLAELSGTSDLTVELLVRPNGRTTPSPFCLMRVDAVHGGPAAPKILRFAGSAVSGAPAPLTCGGELEVQVDSICWESLAVEFEAEEFTIELLRPWLVKWLDPDETRKADDAGLSHVVHDLAWGSAGARWTLRVDLGSAQVAALAELLEAIRTAGAGACTITAPASEPEDEEG
ncbi:MAG: hypothetical protein ACYTKD_30485 [Planctomycetota bacterium]|jgi:hypothetical protein